MGPYAGENYLTRFLVACTDRLKKSGGEVSDQRYPAHYLFQQPVPDRTKALIDGQDEYLRVFFELRAQLKALEHLGVSAAAIACNTAHAWHADLKDAAPQMNLLHIADVCAQHLESNSVERACLMATAGTVRSGMYARALASRGIECIEPDANELSLLMAGIYDGVKADAMEVGRRHFIEAANRMRRRTGVQDFLMACTEIPLALAQGDVACDIYLHDPTSISACRLAEIALD